MKRKFNPIKMLTRRIERSIQTKLALALLVFGLISLSGLGVMSVTLGKQEVQNEVNKRNREMAALIGGQVDSYLKMIVSDLNFAARSLNELPGERDGATVFVFELLKKASGEVYQKLAWIDKNGIRRTFARLNVPDPKQPLTVPFPSALDKFPLNMATDPAYLTTKARNTYYSKVYFHPESNEPMMIIAVPVLDSNDTFQGTLIVEANLRQTTEIVTNVRTDRTTGATLVDESATVVASSATYRAGSQITDRHLQKVLVGSKGTVDYTNERGEDYLAGFAPLQNQPGWGVIVSQSAEEAFAGITRLAVVATIIVVLGMLGISFLAIFLSKTITRPIRELASTANRITTTGNLDEQIPITAQDEVGELSASFNGMVLALRKTRLALEHWNRELEHKVEVRTHELTSSNEKLEHINEQLERANLHKSQFLANMSHELRTPLNAIIGFSEVLQDQVFGDLNEKQTRYVSNILNSGRHLLNLVNDVLDLSKVEAGKMELHWEEFSTRHSIGEVITQLGPLAAKKELVVECEADPELDLITADRGRFRQILYNLVSNSIKFTPQGGLVKICRKLELNEQGERMALFEVHDTGIGINQEHVETIFESFRQVDNSYSRQYQGTGLGLALTRKLIEMHGGKIWVESKPGVGSVFSFTLPMLATPTPEASVFSDTLREEVPAARS